MVHVHNCTLFFAECLLTTDDRPVNITDIKFCKVMIQNINSRGLFNRKSKGGMLQHVLNYVLH